MLRRNSNHLYKLIVNHVKNKKGIKTFNRLDTNLPKIQYDSTFQTTNNFANTFENLKNIAVLPDDEDKQKIKNRSDTNVEKHFYDLDVHVKKYGRISKEQVQDIMDLINSKKLMTPVQTLILIRCCGNFMATESFAERHKLLKDIILLSNQMNVKCDLSHINSLIKIYTENEKYDDLLKVVPTSTIDDQVVIKIITNLFSSIELCIDPIIKPNRITYQRLVSYIAEAGQIDKAQEFLQSMKTQDIPINENIFASLILAYGTQGDLKNAVNMLKVMEQLKLDPTSAIYSKLCQANLSIKNYEEIDIILKKAQSQGVILLNKDVLDILFQAIRINIPILDIKKLREMLIPYIKPHMDLMQCLVNMTYRLISYGGRDVAAYEFFKYYSNTVGQSLDPLFQFNNTLQNSGNFLIKHLVTQILPPHSFQDITYIIKDMHKSGINIYAAQKGLESNFSKTMHLPFDQEYKRYIELMKELDISIRPHYFWPVLAKINRLVALTTENSTNVLKFFFESLNYTKIKYGTVLTKQTLMDYVYPYLQKATNLSNTQMNRLDQIWKLFIENYSIPRDNRQVSLALNSLFIYALYDSSNELFNAITLRHLANFIQTFTYNTNDNINNETGDAKLAINPLLSGVNPYYILNALSRLYLNSINQDEDCESILCDILVALNSTNHKSNNSTPPQQFYDWNGKVLLDIKNNLPDCQKSIRLDKLLNCYSTNGLHISPQAIEQLKKLTEMTDINNIVADIDKKQQIDDRLSLDAKLIEEWQNWWSDHHPYNYHMVGLPTNSNPNDNFASSYPLDNVVFKDVSIDKLQVMLQDMKNCNILNDKELVSDTSPPPPPPPQHINNKIKSLTRHLITRYVKDKNFRMYESNIRSLSNDLLKYDGINLKHLELNDNTLEDDGNVISSPSQLSLINGIDGSLALLPQTANFILVSYSCLVDFYSRIGDGDMALKFKKAREIIFPPYKTSVSKILEICTALTAQILRSVPRDDKSNPSNLTNTIRRNQIFDLLQEAAMTPLTSAPVNTFNHYPQLQNANTPHDDNTSSNHQQLVTSSTSFPSVVNNNGFNNVSSSNNVNNVSPRSNTEYQAWKLLNLASGNVTEGYSYFNTHEKDCIKVLPDFEKVFEATVNLLKSIKGANPSVGVLGTMINAKLNKDDLPGALEMFHEFSSEYRLTPQMTVLMGKLIELNDTENLQKLVDVSSDIHGESNILIDLLFAFVNLSRFKEANKVLETPNMQYRQSRFEYYCARLLRQNKVKELEYLVNAAKNLKDINRDHIYYYLLKAYDNNHDANSALQLWESWLDDEDTNYHLYAKCGGSSIENTNRSQTQPTNYDGTDKYGKIEEECKIRNLLLLKQILTKNEINEDKIPFTIPNPHYQNILITNQVTQQQQQQRDNRYIVHQTDMCPQDIETDKEIMKLLNEQNTIKALELKNQLHNKGLAMSPRTYGNLLDILIKSSSQDLIDEAIKLSREMCAKNLFVVVPSVKALMSKLSQLGRPEDISSLIPCLINNSIVLTKLNVPKYVSYAYTNSGKFLDYLKPYFDILTNDPTKAQLPQGIIYALSKHPEYLEQVEQLAQDYSNKANSQHLYSLLFTYQILANNFNKAREIYESKLKPIMELQKLSRTNLYENNNHTELLKDHEITDSIEPESSNSNLNSRVFFNIITICKNAKSTNDDKPLRFLIEDIGLDGDKAQIGLAYSYWISLKCHNSEYEQALELYNQAIINYELSIQNFKVFALRDLRNCLMNAGREVPPDLVNSNNWKKQEQMDFSDMAIASNA